MEKRFAKNLKRLMDDLDLSQAELARRTGLTGAAICQILKGTREPTLKTVCKILDVIPVTFERMIK